MSRTAAEPPEPAWDLSGVISVVETGTPDTRVTVDLATGTADEPDRAVLIVSPATKVEVQGADGATRRAGADALVPGGRIRAWHSGAELRSLPPQYHAAHIRIVPAS